MRPCRVEYDVGEAVVGAASIPESVGGMVDDVEDRGGCPWRRDARFTEPWRSRREAFTVCEKGGAYSK